MKGSIDIRQTGITDLDTDAVVNAANSRLQEGGGVCGAIFRDAGPGQLADACDRIGGCETGSAVITPGFDLKADYIIHAVGPIWNGGSDDEENLLYSAYRQSLILARQNSCHSIGFPVISSGIYGYPKDQAWEVAIKACMDFLEENPDYQMDITFAVISKESKEMGERILSQFV